MIEFPTAYAAIDKHFNHFLIQVATAFPIDCHQRGMAEFSAHGAIQYLTRHQDKITVVNFPQFCEELFVRFGATSTLRAMVSYRIQGGGDHIQELVTHFQQIELYNASQMSVMQRLFDATKSAFMSSMRNGFVQAIFTSFVAVAVVTGVMQQPKDSSNAG